MDINTKIHQMALKFKQLRTTELPVVQRLIIGQLRNMAHETQQLMRQDECKENTKRRRQIEDMLKKCAQIEKDLDDRVEREKEEAMGRQTRGWNRQDSKSYSQAQLSKMAVRSVIMKEIRSSQLRIKPEEIDQIAAKMEKNHEVMKEIQAMVVEQGNDLDKVDEYLEIAYENSKEANSELEEAKGIQSKTRRMKFRMAVGGFFGALGYKILGLPGMIMGFFFGAKAS